MADNLRLRVVLDLAERVLAPMKRISSSSSDAARALKAAKDRLKELNAQQAQVGEFRTLKTNLQETAAKLTEAQSKVGTLARAFGQAGPPTRAMERDLARAKREAEQRAKREEAARARALLEGRSPAAAQPAAAATQGGRFIVQVGAFADDAAVREARQKAERAGVRTYTQVVNTKDGKRTRVRVGPFGSREEADKAAATLKKAGLAGAVLAL